MHKDEEKMPSQIAILMKFIDRVGFPILAFLLMFWLTYKTTNAINENTKTLIEFRTEVREQHIRMINDLNAMRK